jgi:hypothetical protein
MSNLSYNRWVNWADAVFELMDALAGDTQARTPVELSLSPLFQRPYPSIYDGLDGWRYDEPAVKAWLLQVASTLGHEGFRLIGVDHIPKPRPYANKVADRSFARPGLRQRARVHQPTPTRATSRLPSVTTTQSWVKSTSGVGIAGWRSWMSNALLLP